MIRQGRLNVAGSGGGQAWMAWALTLRY